MNMNIYEYLWIWIYIQALNIKPMILDRKETIHQKAHRHQLYVRAFTILCIKWRLPFKQKPRSFSEVADIHIQSCRSSRVWLRKWVTSEQDWLSWAFKKCIWFSMLEKLKEKQSYNQLKKRTIYWRQLGGLEENGSHGSIGLNT